MSEGQRWYVGVDWATVEHQACVLDENGNVLGERKIAHNATGLDELCAWLLQMAGGNASAVSASIEVPHGAVVDTLLERGFAVHSINPKQMERFRDRFTVAGAKDDRRDAQVLADSLRTDSRCFRRLTVDEPLVIELREWSRLTEDLQQERVRLGNRVREQLRRYYGQALELTDDVASNWFLELWELVPTPAHAARVQQATVERLLKSHRIRKHNGASALQVLRQPALRVAPGTVEAATAHLRVLAARLRLVNEQIKEGNKQLDRLSAALSEELSEGQKGEQRDAVILRSLPGVGRTILATLLAEASQPLRARDYHALRALSGVAPVTRNSGKRSGKRSLVIMRRACNPRLRTAVYHWARCAMIRDPVTRAKYAELRKRGQSHGRALRGIADRLLAVACAMLREASLYDASRRKLAA